MLFPNEQVHTDFIHPNLIYKNSLENMQLDVFIPNLNLAFEYQGKQHYNESIFPTGKIAQSMMDKEKLEACKMFGITLIEVPYWWDFSVNSLVATIKKERSDLLVDIENSNGTPIPQINKGGNKISKKIDSLII